MTMKLKDLNVNYKETVAEVEEVILHLENSFKIVYYYKFYFTDKYSM